MRCEKCGKILNYHDLLDLMSGCYGCLSKEEQEIEQFYKEIIIVENKDG